MITGSTSRWWSEPAAPDPGAFSMFAGWESASLAWLGALVALAVLVFFVGSRRFRQQLGSSAITPRGRDRFVSGRGHRRDAAWRAMVERLEQRAATPIAEAPGGPVRVDATIVGSSGNLGGQPGRECVWRNRAGAGPQTAVGADLIIVADASGRCGVERIEQGRITVPVDRAGTHYESVSLYIGDRVEIFARFEREVVGEHEDPTQLVYGTLGTDGAVDIRLVERAATADPDEAPEPESPEPESPKPESPEPESPEPLP